MSQPPSAQSVAEIRTQSGSSSGQTVRTSSTTSSTNRARFSKRAAVLVGARVRQRREELVQQVAVRGVDLGDAGSRRPARARAASRKPSMTSRMPMASSAVGAGSPSRDRNRARGDGLPATVGDRESPAAAPGASVPALRPACASCMPGTAPPRLDEARDPRPGLGLRVVPDSGVSRRDPPVRRRPPSPR